MERMYLTKDGKGLVPKGDIEAGILFSAGRGTSVLPGDAPPVLRDKPKLLSKEEIKAIRAQRRKEAEEA